MRSAAAALAAVLVAAPALAQPAPAQPDPIVQALAQMLAEAQQREAQALMRAIAAERRAADAEQAKPRP